MTDGDIQGREAVEDRLAALLNDAAGEAFLPPGWQRVVALLPAVETELRGLRRIADAARLTLAVELALGPDDPDGGVSRFVRAKQALIDALKWPAISEADR